jgi:hypothetical protein
MCHGVAGKGDGWLSAHLKQRPASLTQLQKNNGGVFPFDDVYQTIDGRKEEKVHGPREMPVWGTVYRMESDTIYGARLDERFADIIARMRILALIDYLSRLQE